MTSRVIITVLLTSKPIFCVSPLPVVARPPSSPALVWFKKLEHGRHTVRQEAAARSSGREGEFHQPLLRAMLVCCGYLLGGLFRCGLAVWYLICLLGVCVTLHLKVAQSFPSNLLLCPST